MTIGLISEFIFQDIRINKIQSDYHQEKKKLKSGSKNDILMYLLFLLDTTEKRALRNSCQINSEINNKYFKMFY